MLISTIIPVYNAEKYLKRCLDSILNAQIEEVSNEILLIDDGSTDNSLVICKEYANKNPNIKVFSQPNQGPSIARNLGLKHAKGEWISFVDSDDWVVENYFNVFYKNYHSNYNLFVFGYNKVSKKGIIKNVIEHTILDSNLILNQTLSYSNILWFPWNKFYKRKILLENKIKFNQDVRIGEDTLFNIAYIKKIDKIKSISETLYNYAEVETSLTQVKFKENLLINMERHYLERIRLQPDNMNDVADYYINHILFWLLSNTNNSPLNKLSEIKSIRQSIIYKDLFKYYRFNLRKPRQAFIVKLFQLKQYKLLMNLINIYA